MNGGASRRTPYRKSILSMELSKEVQKAKRQVENAIECLIELRSALEGILVYDKGPQVDEESMMIQMLDYHMTRKEAAAFLGKSVRQLDRLCEKNIIRRETVDGNIRIRKAELLRYRGFVIDR